MAYRRGHRPMGGDERFHRAYEIGEGDGAAPIFTVPGLIEPECPIARCEQRCDEAAHLQPAAAPAVNEQDGGGRWRPGLPDGERMPARDDGLSPRIDRMCSPASVTRGQGE